MEELAQVLNIPAAQENAKYRKANLETIGALVGALCGIDSVGDVIDRIVFSVLVGNGDAHLKNWAITYPDCRIPTLSPMYDVLPTVLYIPDDDLGLKINGSRDFASVSDRSFDLLAERSGYGIQKARSRVREAIDRVMANWSILRDLLTEEEFGFLTRRLETLRLTRSQ
jgi:serine/threonine-protein kinase HipA